MTRRIAWLVAMTTSAVVVALVVPLMYVLAGRASDRATLVAQEQAKSTATIVATAEDADTLARAVELRTLDGPEVLVVRSDDTVIGGYAEGLSDETIAAVRRARTEQLAFTEQSDAGLEALVPVSTDSGVDVVVARVPSGQLRLGVPQAWALVLALGSALVLASVLVAHRLGRYISIPVTDVADVAHRLREGDSAARAVPDGPPETAELARALNALADRIHVLVADEREHVADLGHRLRTPVTALRLDAEMVSDPELSTRLRGHVDQLRQSIDDVVREARRPLTSELSHPTDLTEVVASEVAFWGPLAEDQGRRLTDESSPGRTRVALSREAADELVGTLLDNVFAHTPEGTDARVFTERMEGMARLVVEDAGPGLAGPWSGRGHSGGGSTGLGLAIVHRLTEGAGGQVRLTRSSLGGLRVQIDLPIITDD